MNENIINGDFFSIDMVRSFLPEEEWCWIVESSHRGNQNNRDATKIEINTQFKNMTCLIWQITETTWY